MTAQELVEEVFRMAGKPSNLQIYTNPGDDNTLDWALPGVARLLRYINMAVLRIAGWRFPDGRVLRLRGLITRNLFNVTAPVTGVITDAGTTWIEFPGLAIQALGDFNGWICEVTSGLGSGQTGLVVDSGAANRLTLNTTLTPVPLPGDTISLYKSFFNMVPAAIPGSITDHCIILDPVQTLQDVLKVRDITAFADLTKPYQEELFTASMMQAGIPTQYKIFGNQLWFDVALSESRSYEILYVRQPTLLVNQGDVPDIALPYHEAVMLWALHTVQRLYQDLDGAYASKRELEDLMVQLRLQGHFENDYESNGLTVWG